MRRLLPPRTRFAIGRMSMVLAGAALIFACDPAFKDPDRRSTLIIQVECCAAGQLRLYGPKYLVFLPLVAGFGFDTRPRLAETWEHSPDYRTWTFHIRQDVRWHDGVPVTAHDVVFSLELFAHPAVRFPAGGFTMTRVDSISVPDDHTVVMTLKRPSSAPPVGIPLTGWMVVFPRHLLEGLDPARFYQWDFWTRPVGNGPYRFVRRVPQTMVELEANDDFYAGKPSIQRVVLMFSNASPVIELTSRAVDVVLNIGPTDQLKLGADPHFVAYYQSNWSNVNAIYWNQRHPLLADAEVRRALGHAINRRELARIVGYPEDLPLAGGVSNEDLADHPYREGGWSDGPKFDPELAERLLEKAGWANRNADGIRERAGGEARFTLTVDNGGVIPGREMGILVQDQLRRIGVAVDIHPLDPALVFEALRQGDYDALIGWVDNTPSGVLGDWMGLPPPWEPEREPERPPAFGYRDPEAARLLRDAYRAPNLDAQDSLYRRINEILRRDMPVTFLFPEIEMHMAHRRIRGLRSGGESILGYTEELWIEEQP